MIDHTWRSDHAMTRQELIHGKLDQGSVSFLCGSSLGLPDCSPIPVGREGHQSQWGIPAMEE
jgi:hypothetical protein